MLAYIDNHLKSVTQVTDKLKAEAEKLEADEQKLKAKTAKLEAERAELKAKDEFKMQAQLRTELAPTNADG